MIFYLRTPEGDLANTVLPGLEVDDPPAVEGKNVSAVLSRRSSFASGITPLRGRL